LGARAGHRQAEEGEEYGMTSVATEEGEIVVIARYKPKMTRERDRRIRAALERCGVRLVRSEMSTMTVRIDDREVPVPLSDVDWCASVDDDGTETETELTISGFGDDMARATRVAAELRCCGMVASVQRDAS
jgi:hypothetical protein